VGVNREMERQVDTKRQQSDIISLISFFKRIENVAKTTPAVPCDMK
jgi:hypothetical protein